MVSEKWKCSIAYKSNYIERTFDLAKLGRGLVSPNPYVGAVIVKNNEIIGEGWHQKYGEHHAEIQAIHDVDESLEGTTMYVSLEPCSIRGKTPPCTNAIKETSISNVVYSCHDTTDKVKGMSKGILENAGINVEDNVLKNKGVYLAKERNCFTKNKRPYIIIKYAQSINNIMGDRSKQLMISNEFSKIYLHKLRSEVDAIMVGSNTASIDNPSLTNRVYSGNSPHRIILDRKGKLDHALKVFDGSQPTTVYSENTLLQLPNGVQVEYVKNDGNFLKNVMHRLYQNSVTSILIEGGRTILNELIRMDLWDEMRVITSRKFLNGNVAAPDISRLSPLQTFHLADDKIDVYLRESISYS